MRKSQIVAPVLLAMLYSCRSAPQVITIDSSPSNAEIKIDQQVIGRTPMVYTLPKSQARAKSLVIRIEKQGYEEGAKLLTKKGRRFDPKVYLQLERLPPRPQVQYVGVPQAQPAAAAPVIINTGQQTTSNNNNVVPTGPVITGPNNNNAGSANNSSNGGGNGSGNGGNRR